MRRNTTALMALAVCCCAGSVQASYDAADRIGLIPTPREITVGPEQIDLAGWRILNQARRGEEADLASLGVAGTRTPTLYAPLTRRLSSAS